MSGGQGRSSFAETPGTGVSTRLPGSLGSAALLALGAALAGCSLAGDVTPPAALATAQMARPQVAATQPPVQPLRLSPPSGPADLDAGRAIYAEKCAGCHGATGLGDGELAADLEFPPAPLGQADFARQSVPSQWYTAVTVGNLERLMPPFASLSDGERWAVTGYALSLSVATDQLEQGEALYQAECAACHGPDGPGRDLTLSQALVDRSAAQLYAAITQGAGEAMPGFQDELNDDQRWALAAFIQLRDLTASATRRDLAIQPQLAAIRGAIRNRSAGGTVPEGMQVTLHAFDGGQEVLTEAVRASGDGQFAFEGVPVVPGRLFYVSLEYQGLPFRSQIAHLLPDQQGLELPLTIYEVSEQTELLRIERLHLLIDFPAEGRARILQLWALTNPSDRIIAHPQGVLRIRLPAGAFNVQFEETDPGGRFLQTPTGYLDTAPVPPGLGVGDVAFGFDLLFESRLDYEQMVDYPVGAVVILMLPGGASLRAAGAQDLGVLDMGGVPMQAYSMDSLAPGESLAFRISTGAGAGPTGGGLGLLIGGASLGAAMILAALWWYRSPQRRLEPGPTVLHAVGKRETLLRAIARLDDEYEAGKLQEAEYRARRSDLKQQALELAQREAR